MICKDCNSFLQRWDKDTYKARWKDVIIVNLNYELDLQFAKGTNGKNGLIEEQELKNMGSY